MEYCRSVHTLEMGLCDFCGRRYTVKGKIDIGVDQRGIGASTRILPTGVSVGPHDWGRVSIWGGDLLLAFLALYLFIFGRVVLCISIGKTPVLLYVHRESQYFLYIIMSKTSIFCILS